jgi:putative peptidoglycan lipid II flippase
VFAVALYPSLGVQGLALAWSAAYLISAGVALVALRRRIGEIPGRAVGPAVVKAGIATGALAIVTIPLAAAIGRTSPSRALLATAAAATAGGLVYLAVLAVSRSDELRSLLDLVRRRGAMPIDVSP